MSQRNGDKARFGKEHKKKLLRRKLNLALRQSLQNQPTTDTQETGDTPTSAVTIDANES
ncbi:MAG: hypothetical protein JST84_06175 [Acidobacteria bacterium]|nr:hypothetical protein [Acidobacteriota bacterium]